MREKGVVCDEHGARSGERHDNPEHVEPGRVGRGQDAEQPAADDRAADAQTEIPEQAFARPDDELASKETGDQPDDDPSEN